MKFILLFLPIIVCFPIRRMGIRQMHTLQKAENENQGPSQHPHPLLRNKLNERDLLQMMHDIRTIQRDLAEFRQDYQKLKELLFYSSYFLFFFVSAYIFVTH